MPQRMNIAPLYEALVAHAELRATAFHVPGHKQRAVWPEEGAGRFYANLLELDVTELSDTDDLHHPQGPLAQAQRLAAECYGAEETSFLVGGSTAGNLGMILGTSKPGDLFLVQRNVHKSIIHGLMLAGARAVMLSPENEPISGLALLTEASVLETALERYGGDAKAVILSTPNYYGMSRSIETHARIAHRHGIPVLVDEAHGPHFGFHPDFPTSALKAGADVVVHSTHKMLSSMTMGAMLHMQGERIDREAIRQALRMVQSSSPSFPILASIDLARAQLHGPRGSVFDPALKALENAQAAMSGRSIQALGYGDYAQPGVSYDPLKLVLFDETGKLNGFDLRDELQRRNCVAEMADNRYVVMALGTGTLAKDGVTLANAIIDISDKLLGHRKPARSEIYPSTAAIGDSSISEPVVFDRENRPVIAVALEDSIGRLAGEWVIPYPPGIPALYPGETITPLIVEQLRQWQLAGAQIQGASDPQLKFVKVRA